MVFDPADNETVVVGQAPQSYAPQTWLFQFGNWTQLPVTPNLPGEGQQNLVFDAATGYVLMTGVDIMNESWALVGSTWAHLPVLPGPATRSGAAVAFDVALGEVVLFGGSINGTDAGDTWAFSGKSWTPLNPNSSGPPPRSGASLSYDAGLGALLLFGGSGISQGIPAGFNDTWVFNARGWNQLVGAGGPATSYGQIELLFEGPSPTQVGLLVVNGGGYGTTSLWTFNGSAWSVAPSASWLVGMPDGPPVLDRTGVDELFGTMAGSTSPFVTTYRWTGSTWVPEANLTSPPPSPDVALVDDPELGGVLYLPLSAATSEGWVFSQHNWSSVSLGAGPIPRTYESVTYDPLAHGVLLFGGVDSRSHNAIGDTWLLKNLTWSQVIEPAGKKLPAPGSGLAMSYDAHDRAVVLLDANNSTNRSGTWEFAAGSWGYLASPGPVTRQWSALGYDAIDQELVLFGGEGACGPCNDTWTFSGGTWKNVTSPGPSSRTGFGLSTDPAGGVILFGGVLRNQSLNGRLEYPVLGDTWQWSPGGWENLTAALPYAPTARNDPGLAFDSTHSISVLFSGGSPTAFVTPPPFGDTWTYSNSSLSAVGTIESFMARPATLPIGNSTNLTVLLGGGGLVQFNYTNLSGGCVTNDTPTLGCAWIHPGVYEPAISIRDSLGHVARARTIVSEFPALSVNLQASTNATQPGHLVRFRPVIDGGIPPFQMFVTTEGECGSPPPMTPQQFSCSFYAVGVYSVDARVIDSTGAIGNTSIGVCVFAGTGNCSLPQVRNFTAEPPVVRLGGTVTLDTNATGFTPLQFTYLGLPPGCFSENLSRLLCTPLALGTYHVEVTIRGPIGPTASATTSIVVLGTVAGHSYRSILNTAASLLPWLLLLGGVLAVPAAIGGWFIRPRRRRPLANVETGDGGASSAALLEDP